MPRRKPPRPPAPATLLVEVRTEELPPRALQRLSQAFADALAADLRQDEFLTAESAVRVYATPRRLAVQITGVLARAPDKAVENSGPSVKAGLDAEGKPTPALLGFAKKYGVAADRLERRDTPKGEVFVHRTTATGGALDANLGLKVGFALDKLPIPKVMRWGMGDARFVRPVHGLVMLHGARSIPGEVMDVKSANRTLGHRVLAHGPIRLRHADDYETALRDKGGVIASFAERRAVIAAQLARKAAGATLVAGDALLDEITALVEAPAVLAGKFDPAFLEVPQECLILSMQQHQRYIPLRDPATGELLPRFLFVSNMPAAGARAIVHGNERVLRARLSDARFFYDQDRKTRLEARVQRLSEVVYHGKLGSQLERVERIRQLAGTISRWIGVEHYEGALRAAWLSKADLSTEMVGEFPELQGIMGRYYALNDGETEEVAEAIAGHYRPRYAGDALPAGSVAIAVALADKLYTLAGLFGIGQVPTGDRDPFGLRRAALGVLRILVERDLPLSSTDLVKAAFDVYDGKVGNAGTDLLMFISDRLSGYLKERGYSTLEIDAVLSVGHVRVNDAVRQLEAVRAFAALPEAESLAAANKRVVNILKQAEAKGESFANVTLEELREPAERALFEALAAATRAADPLFDQGDFTGYLKSFASLKSPVDSFFDAVMVMVDDPEVRRSRLALLTDLHRQMNRVADISKLAT